MQLARHDYDADQTVFVLTLGTWGSELKGVLPLRA